VGLVGPKSSVGFSAKLAMHLLFLLALLSVAFEKLAVGVLKTARLARDPM
jgi:hypothetical protein